MKNVLNLNTKCYLCYFLRNKKLNDGEYFNENVSKEDEVARKIYFIAMSQVNRPITIYLQHISR